MSCSGVHDVRWSIPSVLMSAFLLTQQGTSSAFLHRYAEAAAMLLPQPPEHLPQLEDASTWLLCVGFACPRPCKLSIIALQSASSLDTDDGLHWHSSADSKTLRAALSGCFQRLTSDPCYAADKNEKTLAELSRCYCPACTTGLWQQMPVLPDSGQHHLQYSRI